MDLLHFTLTTFTAFFAIMNPLANLPIFIGLVKDRDAPEQKKVSRTAVSVAFLIGVAFILFGNYIFSLFSLTIPAFKAAGGFLIFYVGFEMLQSKKSEIHSPHDHSPEADSIAISPLAIPVLAGPGTIVTAMNASSKASIIHLAIIVSCFLLVLVLNHIAFLYSSKLVRTVGNNAIKVIGKIMGLILSIIGTNMIMEGIKLGFGL